MSDVPRSLQSLVSTIHTVVLTADVFQLFIKTALPVSFSGWFYILWRRMANQTICYSSCAGLPTALLTNEEQLQPHPV